MLSLCSGARCLRREQVQEMTNEEGKILGERRWSVGHDTTTAAQVSQVMSSRKIMLQLRGHLSANGECEL